VSTAAESEAQAERAQGQPSERAATRSLGPGAHARTIDLLARYGLLLGFALMLLIFSLLRPETFPTWDNAQTTLVLAAPLLAVSAGLTIVLVMEDFDLSIGGMIGLAGAVSVVLMSKQDVDWRVAILAALAVAIAVGLVNGFLIAYLGLSSFIITLAMGTVLLGAEFLLTDQKTIFENVAVGYQQIASKELLGLSFQIWIAFVFTLIVYLLVHQTEMGRYMHAIGGNREAARLAGLPTARLRLIGFVLVALGACIAGIMISSQAGASTPNSGTPFLLPAFASVFLGTAVFRLGQFNVPGTFVGVLFLSVIQTGLTMVDLSTAVVNIVQGVILVIAVLASRIDPTRA